MKWYLKNATYGILTGVLYVLVTNKILEVYPSAVLRRMIFFTLTGFIIGIIYSSFLNLFRKRLSSIAIKKKIIFSNGISTLLSAFICGISFYLFNVLVLANSASSKEQFIASVHKVTFEIFINFSLFNLIVNLIRGILEIRNEWRKPMTREKLDESG